MSGPALAAGSSDHTPSNPGVYAPSTLRIGVSQASPREGEASAVNWIVVNPFAVGHVFDVPVVRRRTGEIHALASEFRRKRWPPDTQKTQTGRTLVGDSGGLNSAAQLFYLTRARSRRRTDVLARHSSSFSHGRTRMSVLRNASFLSARNRATAPQSSPSLVRLSLCCGRARGKRAPRRSHPVHRTGGEAPAVNMKECRRCRSATRIPPDERLEAEVPLKSKGGLGGGISVAERHELQSERRRARKKRFPRGLHPVHSTAARLLL